MLKNFAKIHESFSFFQNSPEASPKHEMSDLHPNFTFDKTSSWVKPLKKLSFSYQNALLHSSKRHLCLAPRSCFQIHLQLYMVAMFLLLVYIQSEERKPIINILAESCMKFSCQVKEKKQREVALLYSKVYSKLHHHIPKQKTFTAEFG